MNELTLQYPAKIAKDIGLSPTKGRRGHNRVKKPHIRA